MQIIRLTVSSFNYFAIKLIFSSDLTDITFTSRRAERARKVNTAQEYISKSYMIMAELNVQTF